MSSLQGIKYKACPPTCIISLLWINIFSVQGSDSDETKAASDQSDVAIEDDNDDDDDPNNSGMHVNDALNVHDSLGRVLVNVQHPR